MPLSKVGKFMKLLKLIGCGLSKDDVSEPCAVGATLHQQCRNAHPAQAMKAIPVGSSDDFDDFSQCICNKTPGRDSPSSCSSNSASPGGEGVKATAQDSGSKASRTEVVNDAAHGATALAVLTGGTATPTNEDENDIGVSSSVVAMSARDLEDHQLCSTSAIGTFTGTAILEALTSSGQASVAKHLFGGDFPAMIGYVGATPEFDGVQTLRKAEIIDLDEEPVEQEATESLTEPNEHECRHHVIGPNQCSTSLVETGKSKLPPLTVTPSSLDRPTDPFVKPAFPTVTTKGNPTNYFVDPSSAQTANMAHEVDEAWIGKNIVQRQGVKSPQMLVDSNDLGYGNWRSPLHDLPDSDVESIILSREAESPLPMSGRYGIHEEAVDHTNNPLHLKETSQSNVDPEEYCDKERTT